jgi:predicted transglutaminase-like protease
MKDMKIQKYKPGEDTYPFTTKNKYNQSYFADKLIYKGYYNNGKDFGYKEDYRDWNNKGIKYIL